ncbi:CHAP domain-containing protein [Candidatus Mycosynbacter amalyticus]|uniref:CHAP domain-containing protein n=1 Tax=Candidatus Mycosynbacter amalyticus TaxID=2665156 RepID=UPI0021B2E875|nr:CHAP domain-containing protein [Candidatus Mycosynbacter amalyticus]
MNRNYQVRRRRPVATTPPKRVWSRRKLSLLVATLVVGGVVWQLAAHRDTAPAVESTQQAVLSSTRTDFPVIETTGFSDTQKRVLALAQQEYQKNPINYDKTVMKYTEGFEESWCGDFISWVFNQAGTPFVHPDTKYWRIPGVQTLMTYYQQEGAYHEIGDGYKPQMGDVAFYFGETPDGGSSEHVAMVLEVRGDTIVTIGGNEGDDGILRVRYDKLAAGTKGLVAIGASGIGVKS